jgi:uncharacterized membrane protein YedE/YeeE
MKGHWDPFFAGAVLAITSIAYYLARRSALAGSGHVSRLVDRAFRRKNDEDDLLAAVLAATAEHFGSEVTEQARQAPPPRSPSWSVTLPERAVFLGALAIGGALSVETSEFHFALDSGLDRIVRGGIPQAALLLGAGILVGFGARMAGGCTTGHGLVGIAQMHKGSFASTAAFFVAGVTTTWLISRLCG